MAVSRTAQLCALWVYPRACGGTWDGTRGYQAPAAWVYPRACGGTGSSKGCPGSIPGLSPRVRGNHGRLGLHQRRQGSIPARAGEPCCMEAVGIASWVYPRACGGTVIVRSNQSHVRGLSPRVRGNPTEDVYLGVSRGSIPARAGEPWPPTPRACLHGVYPRACGGT